MVAPTLVQVMQAVQVAVATIPNLRGRTDVFMPDQINPPQAVVPMPKITAYHSAFNNGLMHISAQVIVITAQKVDRIGQDNLTTYADVVGANSLKLALEADKTLGGVVSDCTVLDWAPVPIEDVSGLGYYGGVFNLQIYAVGK